MDTVTRPAPFAPRATPEGEQDTLRATFLSAALAQGESLCRFGSFMLRWPGEVIEMSPGLTMLLGDNGERSLPMVLDQAPWLPEDEREQVAAMWREAEPGEVFEFQHRLQCTDGRQLRVLQRGLLQPAGIAGAAPVGLATLHDITALLDAEQKVSDLTNLDELTGLPNRASLLRQIDNIIGTAAPGECHLALMFLEIPRVSEIAATMGFAAADTLAMAVAARLTQLRESHEEVAHLGGGNFALMAWLSEDSAASRAEVLQRAQTLRAQLQAPVTLGNSEIFPFFRIGIANFPADAETAHQLLEASQNARPTGLGAEAVSFFNPAWNLVALRELRLEAELRYALSRGEMSLVYQPQVCLATGNVVGAEALLRWQSAELGQVSPAEFIPIAERSGLITSLGEWVIRQACLQSVQWRQAGLPALRIAVNISPVQFQLGDVGQTLQMALLETGADPASLGVEVTESALIYDNERVATTLHAMKARGIEIALDDFGTGFSSLSRLRDLPFDVLKIDRSFVSDVTAAAESASVTRSIISLAHGLQIQVLAEGVETESQLNMLVASGCDLIQGYYFSRPLACQDMEELLRTRRQLPAHLTRNKARTRTLLLVDDESNIVSALKRLFRRDGYKVLTASSGAEALELLVGAEVDVIISDQRMPGMTGVDFLRRAKTLCPNTIRMTLSGFTDLQSIIDAVNEGAVYKFLTKPWDDERLREHVAQAFQQKEMADENRRLNFEVASAYNDLEELNRRLAQAAERQREHAQLMQASASGARDMVDVLPAAVFGLDPDGMLAYLNPRAADLLPEAQACLGAEPGPLLQAVLDNLRLTGDSAPEDGHPLRLGSQRYLGWLRRLPDQESSRGEILVLVPVDEHSQP